MTLFADLLKNIEANLQAFVSQSEAGAMKILVLLYGWSRANRESAKATKHKLPTVIGWEQLGVVL